jgi:translocation and assembly module TamB
VRWRRHALLVWLALVLLATLCAVSALWIGGTERGAAWVTARLTAGMPSLTIGSVRGSLLGEIRLEDVRWRSARDELDFESLALDWDASAMLTRTLAFHRVTVTRASYRRLRVEDGGGGSPPELPWPLRLSQATVDTLDVTIGDDTLRFADTRLAATYVTGRLAIDELAMRTGDVAIAGGATIGLTAGVDLDVTAEWSAPVAGVPTSGTATLRGIWPELRVQHTLATPFAATSEGTIVFSGPTTVAVTTEWQALAWPGVDTVASPSGRLTLTGGLDAYRYDGAGTVDALGRVAAFAVRGTGERLELAIDELVLSAQGDAGTLRARGAVSLATRDTRLDVDAADFDPQWLFSGWPGRLDGTTSLVAGLTPTPRAAFEAVDLGGELRGYPVTLRGAAAFATPGNVRLDALRLESGSNHVLATGTLDAANVDLAVTAELDNLDLVVPGAGGSVDGDVAIAGTWAEPRVRGRIAARDLAYAGVTVARLDVDGAAGLAAATPLSLTVTADGVRRDSVSLNRMTAVLVGTTAAHAATVEASGEQWGATAVADGGWADGLWSGDLQRIAIDEDVLGAWELDTPAALTLGAGRVTLANGCLVHVSQARVCSEVDLQGRREDRLVVSAQNFELATLRPVLPPVLAAEGVYQLSASLIDVLGDPQGALAITGGMTHVRVETGEAQTFAAELHDVRAGVTLEAGKLELTAGFASEGGGSAAVNASIANLRARDSVVDGSVRFEWPDLGFLALLSPNLERVAGQVAVDVTLGGTVAEPTVDGRGTLLDGSVGLPRWGLVVDGIEATATSADGRTLDFAATGRVDESLLTLSGETVLDPGAGWPTRLTLKGDTVPVVRLPSAEIFATPDLAIDVALPDLTITGSVHVPRASIELETLPEQAVPPSPDAVVHGQTRAVTRAQPLRIATAVDVTFGDDVRYAALNLDTQVSGQLRFESEPGRSATARGTLDLTGTYNAYGQILELEQGQLFFTGPLDNPGLNVRAVRDDLDTTGFDALSSSTVTEVGVELTGTVQAPRTRVFSTPAMNEADALSYLLFGQPARGGGGGLDAEQTSTLEVAALSLGLQQALPAMQRIGTSLGLDELAVRSTTADAGEVMAGKYLSPKIYIRYSYGLFNRIGGLLLRFKVNDRWSIETLSGDQESMDLLYTVEKD